MLFGVHWSMLITAVQKLKKINWIYKDTDVDSVDDAGY